MILKVLTGYHFFFSFLLFYFFLFQYCRISYYRDPTSYFFNPQRAYAPGYSAQRKDEAAAFVEEELNLPHTRGSNDTTPKLCVGIGSIAREGVQYLHYSAGSVLHGLSLEERQDIVLITLLAHADSSRHPEANSLWLPNAADQILDYSAPFEKEEYVQSLEAGEDNQKEKSLFDYANLLEACRATGADFVFIMEDDTVASKGWYPRTMQGLKTIAHKMEWMGRDPTDCKQTFHLILNSGMIRFSTLDHKLPPVKQRTSHPFQSACAEIPKNLTDMYPQSSIFASSIPKNT